MKKLFVSFVVVLAWMGTQQAAAQSLNLFSGEIVYAISVVGGDLSAAERAQAESEITLTIGNDGLLKKVTTNIMANSTEIVMPDSAIIIIDQMGQLFAFGLGKNYIQKTDSMMDAAWNEIKDSIKIEYLTESKLIAGQNCKKAVYTMGGEYYDIYYMDQYTLPEKARDVQLRGLQGVPLEYSMPLSNQEGASVLVVAKSIKYKKKVKPTEFKAPAGVEVKPGEELMKMMGM